MVDSNELIPTPSSTSFKILRLKLIRPPPIWIICNPIVILDLTVGISDDYGVQFNGGKVKCWFNFRYHSFGRVTNDTNSDFECIRFF